MAALWRDGDLRKLLQIERKQMLSDLLGENDIDLPIIYSEHLRRRPTDVHAAAKLNEGIISKRADAPYGSDRKESWLKIKTFTISVLLLGTRRPSAGDAKTFSILP